MPIARLARIALVTAVIAVAIQWWWASHPIAREDLPWTPVDLAAPVGQATAGKLAALGDDPARCAALLDAAGVAHRSVPDRREGASCGWTGAVRLSERARPSAVLACPLAAAVEVWMREVVQPAARDLLGTRVAAIDDVGSYACRPIRGAGVGWSEHARANAIDVTGFRLADGRRITVARDWDAGAAGQFLRAVRDGACGVFATTLSPDYNALHRDHLHLDEARRGMLYGGGACR